MNGLGERTEGTGDPDKKKTIPAKVKVNEGDAWCVLTTPVTYVSLLFQARSCSTTVQRKNAWMLSTSIHTEQLHLSLMLQCNV